MSTPTFDTARFAKVRALHDGTDSPGERASAARRMKAIAETAGLSVKQAIAELDRPKALTAAPIQLGSDFPDDLDWLFGSP